MSFSIEPQKNIPVEEVRAKIEQPVLEDLKRYAECYKSSVSYVVQEVLRNAFARDKKFQAYRHPGAVPTDKKKNDKRSPGPHPVEKTDKTAVA